MSVEKTGVILVNLGTPAAADTLSVARYLRQFLSDPRVVEVPRLLWWLLLNFIIVPLRSRKVSENYRSIWLDEGSPLKVITERQVVALQRAFDDDLCGEKSAGVNSDKQFICTYAMTYGKQSIASRVQNLRDQGANKIVILPLFPQYSASTTAAVYDQLAELVKKYRHIPDIRVVHHYYDCPSYIDALADSIRQHWQKNGQAECLLMSFHGIPQNYVERGDPYYAQCLETARAVAHRLGLSSQQWAFSFQSRFGRLEWVKPYTDVVLQTWAARGLESVDIVCPAFSSDCLETLEEIDQVSRQLFLQAGGKKFSMIPCLNDSPLHIQFFKELICSRV
ncbi:MAG: ferrochelatase [Gammaproteobacteria bacterium]|nr:ferrochelatase [Gammaproteobacteria bacterium]MBQ0839788.1 ferrochelatase [Gammaproteobacteria bacterium]